MFQLFWEKLKYLRFIRFLWNFIISLYTLNRAEVKVFYRIFRINYLSFSFLEFNLRLSSSLLSKLSYISQNFYLNKGQSTTFYLISLIFIRCGNTAPYQPRNNIVFFHLTAVLSVALAFRRTVQVGRYYSSGTKSPRAHTSNRSGSTVTITGGVCDFFFLSLPILPFDYNGSQTVQQQQVPKVRRTVT